MRRILVILALLGTMFLVDTLKTGQVATIENFTLVAIGFVILVAYTFADLGTATLSLPKVTGYILVGMVLGPSVSNILSVDVVKELNMFNTLALGLIALNAGLELSFASMRNVAKTLAATILSKIVLLPILVGGAVLAFGFYMPELFGEATNPDTLLGLALIFAALSLGTSPAIAIAVSSELKAKGRLTDLILGAAIFKDLVVVVVLALVLAIAKPLIDPSKAFGLQVMTGVGIELGLSLVLGGLLGAFIILYVRYINSQMLLFIFCLILAAAEVSQAIHAELLLVFIAAGVVVRNFSKYEHRVLEALNLVSLPTYIIFFTIAGAGIDIDRTFTLAPAAFILFLARALAYYLSSQIGGVIGGEDPSIRNRAWLGYLPQAGVTLGLVGISSLQIPSVAGILADLGITYVALNLLIGPLGLRHALTSMTNKQARDQAHGATKSLTLNPKQNVNAANPGQSQEVYDPQLARRIQSFQNKLDHSYQHDLLGKLESWHRDLMTSLGASFETSANSFKRAEQLVEWTRVYSDTIFINKTGILAKFEQQIISATEQVDLSVASYIDDRLLQAIGPDQDTPPLSFRQKWRRIQLVTRKYLTSRHKPLTRSVPLRSLCKIHTDVALWDHLLQALRTLSHLEKTIVHLIVSHIGSEENPDQLSDEITAIFQHHLEELRQDYQKIQRQIIAHISDDANLIYSPLRPHLLSSVATSQKKKKVILQASSDLKSWSQTFQKIARDEIRLTALKYQIKLKLDHLIKDILLKSIEEISEQNQTLLNDCHQNLKETLEHSKDDNLDDDFMTLQVKSEQAITLLKSKRVTQLHHRFGTDTSLHKLTNQLTKISSSFSGQFTLFHNRSELPQIGGTIESFEFNFSEFLKDCLIENLVHDFGESLNQFREQIINLPELADQLGNILRFSFERNGSDRSENDTKNTIQSSLRISIETLSEYIQTLKALEEATTSSLKESYGKVLTRIEAGMEVRSLTRVAIDKISKIQTHTENLLRRYEHKPVVYHVLSSLSYLIKQIEAARAKDWMAAIKRLRALLKEKLDHQDLAQLSDQMDVTLALSQASPLFRKGFSLEPLRDRKFFSANQSELEEVQNILGEWREGQGTCSILIVGDPGSGKTSLINVIQNDFEFDNAYRLETNYSQWRGNILRSIAMELGCEAPFNSIRDFLGRTKAMVMIDNFEYWFRADASGFKSMQKFMELIATTSSTTSWLISVSSEFYNSYAHQAGFEHTFNRTMTLKPIDHIQLKQVIYDRLSFCGTEVEFRKTYHGNWIERLRIGSDEDIFFRILERVSSGNLYNALALWINAVIFISEKTVQPSTKDWALDQSNYLGDVSQVPLSILVLLNRIGPLTEKALGDSLGLNRSAIKSSLRYLNNQKILESKGRKAPYYQISKSIRPSIASALARRY